MQSNTLLKLFNATLMIMFSSPTDRALISIQETIRKPWRMLKHALNLTLLGQEGIKEKEPHYSTSIESKSQLKLIKKDLSTIQRISN